MRHAPRSWREGERSAEVRTRAGPTASVNAPEAPDERLVRRIKLFGVCLLLSAVGFSIDPERILGDTKIDLVINPLGFLERALHLWDGAYFGQLQNQAYGYFFPNGPFHALFLALDMPEWIVQRLWMTLLLCAAFLGVVYVARALGIGTLHTQIVAGVAYALAPRVLTLLSYNSAELQPTMLLPWVLLPLIHGARHGVSPRRAAMLSAVAFLFCGGTNAASELAILVVPLLYLITRQRGPRTRRLLGWWLLAIFLVSFWWLAPLLIMGRYVYSFMPYTEDASTTTGVTSLINAVRGTSNWMGYVPMEGQPALPAGAEVSSVPWLVAVTAIVAGLGLAGLANRRIPERTFLIVTVLTGVAIVVSGYAAEVSQPVVGPFAEMMRAAYDGILSPFRNIHKFDAVIRLPVVLGLAYLPLAVAARVAVRPDTASRVLRLSPDLARRVVASVCGAAVLASLAPIATVGIATRGGFEEMPDYWQEATTWIDNQGGTGMTLAVPGSARGEYQWGRPMDEPMQPLMETRWSNHQIIPWGSSGISRIQHEIDQRLSSGQGSSGLTALLSRLGVEHLLVRNDLQREGNNGAWPGRVHQALADSPGVTHAHSFGPEVGNADPSLAGRWFDQPLSALDVYTVDDPAPVVGTLAQDEALRVTGAPEAALTLAEQGLVTDDRPVLLGEDPHAEGQQTAHSIATDTARLREVVYPEVRNNVSATLTDPSERERDVPAPDVMDPAWEPYTAAATYRGIADVRASTAQSTALAGAGSRDPGAGPFAALDGDDTTAWRSGGYRGAVGQWLEVELEEPRDISGLSVAFAQHPGDPPPAEVDVITDDGEVRVSVEDTTQLQELEVPPGETSTVRLRVASLAWEPEYRFGSQVGVSELYLPGVESARVLPVDAAVPDESGTEDTDPDGGPGATTAADTVVLSGSTGHVPGCMQGPHTWVCDPDLEVHGEDTHRLDRDITGLESGDYRISGQVIAADARSLENTANRGQEYPRVRSSSTVVDHPAAIGHSALDGDSTTVWYPDPQDPQPSLDLDLGREVELDQLRVDFPRSDAITAPVGVTVDTPATTRSGWVDSNGNLTFEPVTTEELTLTFDVPAGQPLEISGIELPDVDPLPPVEDRELDELGSACGLGPVLRVDGERVETRIVDGDAQTQLDGDPLTYESCSAAPMDPDGTVVTIDGGDAFRILSGIVQPAGDGAGTSTPSLPGTGADEEVELAEVDVAGWGDSERRLEIDVDEDSYLVVNENFNEGWEATVGNDDTPLRPVRLDGWRQAWEVSEGTAATVTLSYAPDRAYHAALGAGALFALTVVAGAALRPRRRDDGPATLPTAGAASLSSLLLVPLALAFGVWIAGVAGALVSAVVLGASWWLGRSSRTRTPGSEPPSALASIARRLARALASPWVVVTSLTLAGLAFATGNHLQLEMPFAPVSGVLADPLQGWVPQLLCLPALTRLMVSLWRFDDPPPAPADPVRQSATIEDWSPGPMLTGAAPGTDHATGNGAAPDASRSAAMPQADPVDDAAGGEDVPPKLGSDCERPDGNADGADAVDTAEADVDTGTGSRA
ncbi:alpha-(1-_3)-arabinofuranosyltransferase [Lipingzhangella sp. LS1_29]|uniref:Alpha-(1->3)-arabinofuranosyltransferase n=1 Tax=Lipingzhangella rawalii TaxID=2055835 RepID=A0ABU2HAB4_9ACTN|nr:alpha-(1->3)-arabinofuranosyltransferase [Lipingzhangella rawalii]MDS1272206.1 alpha-(1->3)-arabinofuranosyltransferase [Lipingzhangella rawalii]